MMAAEEQEAQRGPTGARAIGWLLVAAGGLLNIWTLAAIFRPVDGSIEPRQRAIIWAFDVVCLAGGVSLLYYRPALRVRLRYVVFSFVPLIVLLLAAEGVARVVPGESRASNALLVEDAILHHKWAPNLDLVYTARGEPFRFRTNSQSWLEDYDIRLEKPSDTYRIFYVGDSTTAGVVRKDARVPDLVEARLNASNPAGGRKVEIINTGTSTYSTISYYLLIKNTVLKYSPDLVVIQYDMTDVPNDLEYWPCTELDADGLPVRTMRPCSLPLLTPRGSLETTMVNRIEQWLSARSVLFRAMDAQWLKLDAIWTIRTSGSVEATRVLQLNRVAPTALAADWVSLEWTPEIERNVTRSMELLGSTLALLKSKNIRVLLTGVPHFLQYTGAWSTRPHAVFEETAQRYGAVYFNSYEALTPAIRGTDVREYYWLVDNTHFNEKGNEIWADAEVDFMLKQKLFEGIN